MRSPRWVLRRVRRRLFIPKSVELQRNWNVREPSHSLAARFVEQARIARLLFPIDLKDREGIEDEDLRLTPRQAQALLAAYAADGPTTAVELGTALGLDRSTLHGALDDLAEKGWIQRVADPDDGRRRQIVLLADGRAAAAKYVAAADAGFEE